jgi:hypothetical protein
MGIQARPLAARERLSRLALGVILVGAVPALGFGLNRTDQEIRSVLVQGADELAALQGDYTNACGDAYGPPAVDVITDTWEWEIGSGQTCWNIGGATALGLLAAYERTRDRDYLGGARLYGETLREKYRTIAVDDPEGAEWEDRPFSSDIEFLARLARDGHDRSLVLLARRWHGLITSNKTARENVDRLVDARFSLSGWDVASQIRAALDVGQWRYARDMASRLLERRVDWEGVPLGGYDYSVLSYASLVDALTRLPWATPSIRRAIVDFHARVMSAQSPDGSWQTDPQLTAYAVMGLDAFQRWWGRRRADRGAVAAAFAFLRDTQLDSGGWGSPEYGESNAEVLVAVARLRARDLSSRHGFAQGVRASAELPRSSVRPALFPER